MAVLQRFTGHADPRTTQRSYDRLEVEDLAEAMVGVPEVHCEGLGVDDLAVVRSLRHAWMAVRARMANDARPTPEVVLRNALNESLHTIETFGAIT